MTQHREFILRQVAQKNDITMPELAALLATTTAVGDVLSVDDDMVEAGRLDAPNPASPELMYWEKLER